MHKLVNTRPPQSVIPPQPTEPQSEQPMNEHIPYPYQSSPVFNQEFEHQSVLDDVQNDGSQGQWLTMMRAILDTIEYGVVLFDAALRTRVVNRAAREIWEVPDALFETDVGPSLSELMHLDRIRELHAKPNKDWGRYVQARVAEVAAGEVPPTELRRNDGRIFQYQCMTLPDGGRMLTYFNITDITRKAEQAKQQTGYLEALHETTVGLIRHLDLDTLLKSLLGRALHLLNAKNGLLHLVEQDEDGDELLRLKVSVSDDAGAVTISARKGEGMMGRVWEMGQPLVVNDYDTWSGRMAHVTPNVIGAVLTVPLLERQHGYDIDRVVGVLAVAHTPNTDHHFDDDDVEILTRFAQLATIALNNADMYRALEAANHQVTLLNRRLKAQNVHLEAELAAAQKLQQMLLPTTKELSHVGGLDIGAAMIAASHVGGDYYDVLQYEDCVTISIGDVTGHGLESGVLMLMAQTALRTLLTAGERDPKLFLAHLNRLFYESAQRVGPHYSFTLSVINYQHNLVKSDERQQSVGTLRVSGYHEEMIIVRQGGTIELLDTWGLGFPIGVTDNISDLIDEREVTLESGDGVILYTDGITEAVNKQGTHYGIGRLCDMVRHIWRNAASMSAEAIKDKLIQDVLVYIDHSELLDDLTIVVMKQM
ncbi:MAG: SpoIIE family protein phosphatase [Chloroflexota bacterium]